LKQGIKTMKPEIHPEYKEVKVTCSCGNVFSMMSTYSKDEMHIEICSACHPFYTGQQKIVDTAGRVDKFKQKYGNRSQKTSTAGDTAAAA
jgi:large subunit ribosomal protein L31